MAPGYSAVPDERAAEVIEVPDFHDCTALVLGAGASAPYCFPCAKQLVEDICRDFPYFFARLDRYGSTPDARRSLAERFVHDLKEFPSIDEFLLDQATDSELLPVGRIAVASALLPKEHERRLQESNDWYKLLFSWWWGRQVKLAVITFNYDRSFEQAFYAALIEKGCSRQRARSLLTLRAFSNANQMIKVIHVHGHFGFLPWSLPPDHRDDAVPYGIAPKENLNARVTEAAEQIRFTFQQETRRSILESSSARYYLARASRVLFFGFGYDRSNLERINPAAQRAALRRDATIAGTALGMIPEQVEDVRRRLAEWAGPGWKGSPEIVPKTILEAMREYNWLG